jgi:hypothetical protein
MSHCNGNGADLEAAQGLRMNSVKTSMTRSNEQIAYIERKQEKAIESFDWAKSRLVEKHCVAYRHPSTFSPPAPKQKTRQKI